MSATESLHLVQPGEPAPDFELQTVQQPGTVSLSDYRGKHAVFLALFVGLYCPFCRRSIAQLGSLQDKLKAVGVETLGVVATDLDNAKLYFKYRPSRMPLAVDPQLSTHRAYGLSKIEVTEELMKALSQIKINPTGELTEPAPPEEVAARLDQADGYKRTETDMRDIERQWPLPKGQFLVDKDGILRWAHIECGNEGLAGIGKFPPDQEILAAARMVS
jgi:peroxiredoxin